MYQGKGNEFTIRINLLGYKTHRHYPNDSFFKIAKEVGNRIIIGTDAHESQSLLDIENVSSGPDNI